MLYNVQEIFYSLKGEGQWIGQPMSFIRLSGCNLNCSFCDTVHEQPKAMTLEEIVDKIKEYPTSTVVLTGGEPLLQPVKKLLEGLKANNFAIHLETNCTQDITDLRDLFSWIAVSPKSPIDTLSRTTLSLADEVKFLCGLPDWEEYVDRVRREFSLSFTARLYLQPIAKSKDFYKGLNRSREELIDTNIEAAKSYCLHHPEFSFSLQVHKVLGVR